MSEAIIQGLIYFVCVGYAIWQSYHLGFGCGEDKGRKDMQEFMICSKPAKEAPNES